MSALASPSSPKPPTTLKISASPLIQGSSSSAQPDGVDLVGPVAAGGGDARRGGVDTFRGKRFGDQTGTHRKRLGDVDLDDQNRPPRHLGRIEQNCCAGTAVGDHRGRRIVGGRAGDQGRRSAAEVGTHGGVSQPHPQQRRRAHRQALGPIDGLVRGGDGVGEPVAEREARQIRRAGQYGFDDLGTVGGLGDGRGKPVGQTVGDRRYGGAVGGTLRSGVGMGGGGSRHDERGGQGDQGQDDLAYRGEVHTDSFSW